MTGEPRPPRAPNFRGNDEYNASTQDRRGSRKPSHHPVRAPCSPGARGAPGPQSKVGSGACSCWTTLWQAWLVIVLCVVAATLTIGSDRCSAGADWIRYRKSWVRTYELDVIMIHYTRGRPTIRLTDHDKRMLDVEARYFWEDRLIWDLLHNGIRHSAARVVRALVIRR